MFERKEQKWLCSKYSADRNKIEREREGLEVSREE